MKKSLTLFISLLLLATLWGCSQSNTPQNTPSNATITDFLNRQIKISRPEKIISLTASNTEILYALGLGDKLVGVDAFSDYPADAKTKEVVGDFSGPNLERIIALEPDLVLAGNKLQAETITALENAGITVIAAEATTYEQIYASIDLIGRAAFAEAEAIDNIKEQMRVNAAQIKALAEGKTPKTAYYVLSYGEYGDYSVGPGSYIYELLTMAGCDFLTKNMEYAFPKFSVETVVSQNPEIIIYDSTSCTLEQLRQAAGYKELDAVKNGAAIAADGNKFARPTPRAIEEALNVAKKIWE